MVDVLHLLSMSYAVDVVYFAFATEVSLVRGRVDIATTSKIELGLLEQSFH